MSEIRENLRKVAAGAACLAEREETVIAVESRDHAKNKEISPKDHTSRINNSRMVCLALLLGVFIFNGCDKNNEDDPNGDGNGKLRYDGCYYFNDKNDPTNSGGTFLRFYDDGTAIVERFDYKPYEITFNKEGMSTRTYKIDGNNFSIDGKPYYVIWGKIRANDKLIVNYDYGNGV
jgi:hypothetical protein